MANTRIAPSPTGDMHLGTLRTAYFNWLVARSTQGKFILRIDDTDLDRNDESKVEDIYSIMKWAGLDWDFTIRQSQRIPLYRLGLRLLEEKGRILWRNGAAYLNFFDGLSNSWRDTIAGEILLSEEDWFRIKGNNLGENGLVLWTSKDRPTYHFATTMDDLVDEITWIIRGKDHTNNTPKQIAILNALKDIFPQMAARVSNFKRGYSHIGLLFQNKKKLSKRDNAASCLKLKEEGFDPEVVLNFVLKMGWGPKNDDKTTVLLDKARALSMFLNEGSMRNADSNVDFNILNSLQKKWKNKRKLDDVEIVDD